MNACRLASACLLLLAGCAPPHGGKLVQSSKARLSASTVPAADVQAQANDNTDFAFALYAQLATTPGNLFFSPYSISSALAMTWAGAANDTATGMATALHFSMPQSRVHPAFNALDTALASRSGTDDQTFQLHVANAIWTQLNAPIEAPFLDTLAENYGAGVRQEDFAHALAASVADINAWVSDETNGSVPELLQAADVPSTVKLVLTNAISFDAGWAHPFEADATHPAPFHALDGSTLSVPLMGEELTTGYAEGTGWKAIELPYSNPDETMTVIVPDDGQFAAIEAKLSRSFVADVLAAETPVKIDLDFPKFELKTSIHLAQPLSALGMGAAFTDAADFSGIDGQRDLAIRDVVHQATVKVDETGTVATAATTTTARSFSPYPIPFTIDRPFIMLLRDKPTGTVLFLGRVTNP